MSTALTPNQRERLIALEATLDSTQLFGRYDDEDSALPKLGALAGGAGGAFYGVRAQRAANLAEYGDPKKRRGSAASKGRLGGLLGKRTAITGAKYGAAGMLAGAGLGYLGSSLFSARDRMTALAANLPEVTELGLSNAQGVNGFVGIPARKLKSARQ